MAWQRYTKPCIKTGMPFDPCLFVVKSGEILVSSALTRQLGFTVQDRFYEIVYEPDDQLFSIWRGGRIHKAMCHNGYNFKLPALREFLYELGIQLKPGERLNPRGFQPSKIEGVVQVLFPLPER